MRNTSRGLGASVLLFLLSAIAGIAVTLFLIVSLGPLVSLFPASSGAREVAWGIALMWGAVVAATVGVFSFGSFRRLKQKAPDYYDPSWQSRFVPAAPSLAERAIVAAPAYFVAPAAPSQDPALAHQLRQMEALMAANRALVDRIERTAAPRPAPMRQHVAPLAQAPAGLPPQRTHAAR